MSSYGKDDGNPPGQITSISFKTGKSTSAAEPNGTSAFGYMNKSGGMATEGSTLIFKDVGVIISKKEILKRVSGMATVGEILAIMGPSGAGKSTLLNTLAGRINHSSGTITVNGEPVTRKVRRKISYVLQAEIFFPNLTLRETLTFTTLLRLPDSMPHELKMRRVQEIVDALELNKCMDTNIGGTLVPGLSGLSGGERKRAAIACELLTNPKLLLLDEPTSGLDSAIAYSLMSTMAKYSKQSSKTVLTTIHQPSSQIFHMFSKVLLLTEGQVAYYGHGNKIIDFFSRLGLHCDPLYNPSDFILEQVKSDPETVKKIIDGAMAMRNDDDWPIELRKDSSAAAAVAKRRSLGKNYITIELDDTETPIQSLERINYAFTDNSVTIDGFDMTDIEKNHCRFQSTVKEVDVESYMDDDATWQTGFMTQYATLTRRALVSVKGRLLSPLNLCQVVVIILCGLEWFQLDRSEETMNDRLGILYFLNVTQGLASGLDAVHRIFDRFGVFHRERSSGIYRTSAYYMAMMTSEIPFTFILTSCFAIVVYWMTNLTPEAGNFFAFWGLLLLTSFVAQSFGLFVGVLIKNKEFVVPIMTTVMVAFLLTGSFYNSHVAGWLVWLRYLSYVTYALSAMAMVEYQYGHPFECNPPDRTVFPDSCTNGTTVDGIEFLQLKNLTFFPIYGHIILLVGLIIVLRVITYVLLRYFRRPNA